MNNNKYNMEKQLANLANCLVDSQEQIDEKLLRYIKDHYR